MIQTLIILTTLFLPQDVPVMPPLSMPGSVGQPPPVTSSPNIAQIEQKLVAGTQYDPVEKSYNFIIQAPVEALPVFQTGPLGQSMKVPIPADKRPYIDNVIVRFGTGSVPNDPIPQHKLAEVNRRNNPMVTTVENPGRLSNIDQTVPVRDPVPLAGPATSSNNILPPGSSAEGNRTPAGTDALMGTMGGTAGRGPQGNSPQGSTTDGFNPAGPRPLGLQSPPPNPLTSPPTTTQPSPPDSRLAANPNPPLPNTQQQNPITGMGSAAPPYASAPSSNLGGGTPYPSSIPPYNPQTGATNPNLQPNPNYGMGGTGATNDGMSSYGGTNPYPSQTGVPISREGHSPYATQPPGDFSNPNNPGTIYNQPPPYGTGYNPGSSANSGYNAGYSPNGNFGDRRRDEQTNGNRFAQNTNPPPGNDNEYQGPSTNGIGAGARGTNDPSDNLAANALGGSNKTPLPETETTPEPAQFDRLLPLITLLLLVINVYQFFWMAHVRTRYKEMVISKRNAQITLANS